MVPAVLPIKLMDSQRGRLASFPLPASYVFAVILLLRLMGLARLSTSAFLLSNQFPIPSFPKKSDISLRPYTFGA